MSTVNCPGCGETLDLDPDYRDWTVRCPHCGREFVPSEVSRSPRPARRREEPEEEAGEYVYGYGEEDRQKAKDLVFAPAICLELCGWGGFIIAGVGCVLLLIGGMNQANNPNGGDDGGGFLMMSCCLGVVLLPYSLAMAVGGWHMRNLSSRGWAMAAAILGVASFSVVSVCGALHTGFGAWALIVLDKPVVRRAFKVPDRSKQRWED